MLHAVDQINVFVADRDLAVVQAIVHRLDAEFGLCVVGSAQSAWSAAAGAVRTRPDVVVLDEGLADGELADVGSRLVAPDLGARLVVTSASDDSRRAIEAVQAGAAAFVTKASGFDELVRAIVGAHRGESWIPPRLLTGVLDELRAARTRPESDDRIRRLTQRECDVLRCMMLGYDRARISVELQVSINTVRTHTQNILTKLGAHSSLEAVCMALQGGFPDSMVAAAT
jgi:DNA-binding NarL/FixJ family response regulator